MRAIKLSFPRLPKNPTREQMASYLQRVKETSAQNIKKTEKVIADVQALNEKIKREIILEEIREYLAKMKAPGHEH